jgi:DNA-binding CsgD family transcriptional regulator
MPSELEIVLKLSRGMTSKEMADSMQLSARTVETYRFDLIRKTKVKNSLDLIRFVYQNGVFS